jgi:outer membrane protein
VSRAFLPCIGKGERVKFKLALLFGVVLAGPAFGETLDDAIARALSGDPSLQSARTGLETSRLSVSAARAERLPTITGSVGSSRSWIPATGRATVDENGNVIDGSSGGGVTTRDTGSASVSLSETLYNGGRTSAAINQAKANLERTNATVKGSEDTLIQQVVTAYTGVVYSEAALTIRREQVERLMREVDAAQVRFDAGAGTRTDVYQTQAQLAQARSDLASAQSDLAAQRATYERRVGGLPSSLEAAPVPNIPANADEAKTLARDNSTAVRAARATVKAAQAQVDSAYAGYKPTIGISAGNNWSGGGDLRDLQTNSSSVSARVSVPIFNFGRTPIAVASAKANQKAAEYDLADALRASDEATTTAWARLVAAQLTLESSQAQLNAAAFAARGAEVERREGLRTELDLLTQLEAEHDAQLAVASSRRNLVINAYSLLQTIGIQPRPGQAQNPQTPNNPASAPAPTP